MVDNGERREALSEIGRVSFLFLTIFIMRDIINHTQEGAMPNKLSAVKRLAVPEGKMGNFTFTVYLGGCGSTAEEAWEDVLDSIASEGLGPMLPNLKNIKLDEIIDN